MNKKPVSILIILITLPLLLSCKKSYECTCTSYTTEVYKSFISEWDSYVETLNNPSATLPSSNKHVETIDKVSKNTANSICTSTENTNKTQFSDIGDKNGNGISTLEAAYELTYTVSNDCELERK